MKFPGLTLCSLNITTSPLILASLPVEFVWKNRAPLSLNIPLSGCPIETCLRTELLTDPMCKRRGLKIIDD